MRELGVAVRKADKLTGRHENSQPVRQSEGQTGNSGGRRTVSQSISQQVSQSRRQTDSWTGKRRVLQSFSLSVNPYGSYAFGEADNLSARI